MATFVSNTCLNIMFMPKRISGNSTHITYFLITLDKVSQEALQAKIAKLSKYWLTILQHQLIF